MVQTSLIHWVIMCFFTFVVVIVDTEQEPTKCSGVNLVCKGKVSCSSTILKENNFYVLHSAFLDKEAYFNPMYTGRLFHCHMLDESICHCRGIGSMLSLLFYFLWKILLSNIVDSDQTSHYRRLISVCTICL